MALPVGMEQGLAIPHWIEPWGIRDRTFLVGEEAASEAG